MGKFSFKQDGACQVAELDGEDISRFIREVSFDVGVNELPVVSLELAVFELETVAGEAKIHIAPGTEDLLKRFGWTPPEESA